MDKRQGKVFRVDDPSELTEAQRYEADVVIDRDGTVVVDRKGVANRKATNQELRKAIRIK